MKLLAAAAIAGGCLAAPFIGSGTASATPPTTCDGSDCVPYVNIEAHAGGPCTQNTRYNFGSDGSGSTLACNSKGMWVSSPQLVGVRTLRSPCDSSGVAQSPDGVPLKCDKGAWTADYWVMFYG